MKGAPAKVAGPAIPGWGGAMRTLIDGYNLMHAAGLMERRFGPDGFRKVRHRFLNDLACRLGPEESRQTTIVFDAHHHPRHLGAVEGHKGLTVLFAVGYEDADSHLEDLIKHHSHPKSLCVVSSDHRVRDAARRRGAQPLESDEFLDRLDRPRPHIMTMPRRRRLENDPSQAAERDHWLREFGHLEDGPELTELRRPPEFVPTREELAKVAQEVAAEGDVVGRKGLFRKKIG